MHFLKLLCVFYLFLGCNRHISDNASCVIDSLNEFEEYSENSYISYMSSFEGYLINKGFLMDNTLHSWYDFIENRGYCSISENELGQYVNLDISSSPLVGEIIATCPIVDEVNSIDMSMLGATENEYILSVLSQVTDEEFKQVGMKLFVIYSVSLRIGTCSGNN